MAADARLANAHIFARGERAFSLDQAPIRTKRMLELAPYALVAQRNWTKCSDARVRRARACRDNMRTHRVCDASHTQSVR